MGGVLFSLHSFFYTFLSSGTDKSDGNVDDTRIGICILYLIFMCVTFLDLTWGRVYLWDCWNVHLLMTEFDCPEVTMCSVCWQDIKIWLLSNVRTRWIGNFLLWYIHGEMCTCVSWRILKQMLECKVWKCMQNMMIFGERFHGFCWFCFGGCCFGYQNT